MQPPYHRQREQQNDEVFNNAQTCASEADNGGNRQAFHIGDGLVPNGADGKTLEDYKEEEHETMEKLLIVSSLIYSDSLLTLAMKATIPRTLHLNHLMKSGNKREYSERMATFEKICTAT